MATLRPGQDLTPLLTEDDYRAFEAEMEAAARGDAAEALRHHLSGLIVEESIQRYQLRELVDLGEDAPGWVYSRWCADQAYRWMLMNQDPRTDETIRSLMVTTHLEHVEPLLLDEPVALTEYGTLIAACDSLAEQLCFYTSGGLRDFLEVLAQPGLVERADRIEEWAESSWGTYRLVEERGNVVVVHDLVDELDLELLNIGSFVDQSDHVLGRVVPISVPPFRMFESRPVPLDATTAVEVAVSLRDQDEPSTLLVLARACDQGRLERGFSCHGITLFSSDIVPEPPLPEAADHEIPGRLRELLAAGLSEYVANGVMVAEVALIAATVTGERIPIGPHLASVMTDSAIVAAIAGHCVAPEHEQAWRALAAVTNSPVTERCEEMARRCGRPAA